MLGLGLGLDERFRNRNNQGLFKMFLCVLRLGPIIKFLGQIFRWDFFCANTCSFSTLLINSCQPENHLVLLFSPFLQLSLSDLLCKLLVWPPFLHHPCSFSSSSQISLYSLSKATKTRARTLQFLHKSRKHKYAFLPHWPVRHVPYLALLTISLSHPATMLLQLSQTITLWSL